MVWLEYQINQIGLEKKIPILVFGTFKGLRSLGQRLTLDLASIMFYEPFSFQFAPDCHHNW